DLLNAALGAVNWYEIAETYADDIINDIRAEHQEAVKGPGKFEGEPAYASFYYEESLNGCFEHIDFDNGEHIEYVEITKSDAEIFPELAEHVGAFILLTESDSGFVHVVIRDREEIDRLERLSAAESADSAEQEGE